MTNKYNFLLKCPSINDYETYLKSTEENEFTQAFKLHLNECEICNEAINGYQMNGVFDIYGKLRLTSKSFLTKNLPLVKYRFHFLSYAASIIFLIGLTFIYRTYETRPNNIQETDDIEYSNLIESQQTGNKKLTKKVNDQFIYLSNCDKIAYNDQFLSVNELSEIIKGQTDINLITIEVANHNDECASELINLIKKQTSAPVITISNGLKKLTPWGGDFGG